MIATSRERLWSIISGSSIFIVSLLIISQIFLSKASTSESRALRPIQSKIIRAPLPYLTSEYKDTCDELLGQKVNLLTTNMLMELDEVADKNLFEFIKLLAPTFGCGLTPQIVYELVEIGDDLLIEFTRILLPTIGKGLDPLIINEIRKISDDSRLIQITRIISPFVGKLSHQEIIHKIQDLSRFDSVAPVKLIYKYRKV